MPVNKDALLRYRIIDACLTNKLKTYPTLKFLHEKVEEQTGEISTHMIVKDIQDVKKIYNAPIY